MANIPRIVGTDHLVVCLKQNGSEKVFDCIGFNMGNYCDLINKDGSLLDIVFTIDKTVKDGRIYPQFKFKDIKVKDKNRELIDVRSF